MAIVPRTPMALHQGDTIRRHPDHPDRDGRWVVKSRQYAPGDLVDIDYRDGDDSGRFVVDPTLKLAVEPEPRMAVISGLRQLASYLETHPGVPVEASYRPGLHYSVDAWHATGRRQVVDDIADALGVETFTNAAGHYIARRIFEGVVYEAFTCHPEPASDEETTR